jgi:tol-pal system protein YbgF
MEVGLMKRHLCSLIVAGFILVPAAGGTKEELIRLQSDVLQLQDLIRALQKSLDERNGTIVSLLEQLNDQAGQTQLALEKVDGSLAASRTQDVAVERAVAALKEDFQVLNAKLEENQVQIQTLRTVPTGGAAEISPDRVYSATYNDYLMGNFALAINGFQDFLASFPESEYADNAAYYLGDCYLQQGRYELAIQAFDQVINLYPKGDKTPVAYFKKAFALQQMQKFDDAIDSLKKLRRLFPKSQEAELAQQELVKLGAG